MKRNSLASAVITGLVFCAGIAMEAQALNINPLGTGQVLVFPYYTVNAGNQTLISVVNKTDAGKAIKVRLREGRNSRAVIEFNLYLSPFDVWTASSFSLSDTGPNNPANLITIDNSCTVPRIKGSSSLPALTNGNRYAPFTNFSYTGTFNDAGPDTLDRTREGYFEMIEMGEVVDRELNSLTAITHGTTGVPANCLQIERAWLPLASAPGDVAYWSGNALIDLNPPRGGLYGAASIVDVLAGTMMSYDADAIDGFSEIVQHTTPRADTPSLATPRSLSNTVTARVFSNGALVSSTYPLDQAVDAMSALFMQDEIYNEFVTATSSGAASEWVATFPTKFAYTDQAIVGAIAIAPFLRIFPLTSSSGNNGVAPVDVKTTVGNRESRVVLPCEQDPECLPFPGVPPPPPPPFPAQWSWASNVITFNQPMAETAGSTILGSRLASNQNTSYYGIDTGWSTARFFPTTGPAGVPIAIQRMRPDQSGGYWYGLPVIGFWAASYTNGELVPGVLSNYAAAYKHRGSNRYLTSP
jgi:hypothetical protein